MDTKVLEDIGLTPGEIKVYLALLELGSSSAGAVLEKTGIQNSVFHFCVNRLIEKGLVSFVKKNKFRLYSAAPPESFLNYVKDKEKKLIELLPSLKEKQTFAKDKQEVEIYEGIKGVITLSNLLIEDSKKGDELLLFTAELDKSENTEEIQKFFEKQDIRRKEKGLIVKAIANIKYKYLFEKRKSMQTKYTPLPVPANTGICNDKMVMISWGDKPMGVLIRSKQLIQKQKTFFNAFWNSL